MGVMRQGGRSNLRCGEFTDPERFLTDRFGSVSLSTVGPDGRCKWLFGQMGNVQRRSRGIVVRFELALVESPFIRNRLHDPEADDAARKLIGLAHAAKRGPGS